MDIVRSLKRTLVGIGGLVAIPASSAVHASHPASDPLTALSTLLSGGVMQLEAMLAPAQAGTPDSAVLALLAMMCMAIVVKRKSGT